MRRWSTSHSRGRTELLEHCQGPARRLVGRIDLECLAKRLSGFFEAAHIGQTETQLQITIHVRRTQADRGSILLNRFPAPPLILKRFTKKQPRTVMRRREIDRFAPDGDG